MAQEGGTMSERVAKGSTPHSFQWQHPESPAHAKREAVVLRKDTHISVYEVPSDPSSVQYRHSGGGTMFVSRYAFKEALHGHHKAPSLAPDGAEIWAADPALLAELPKPPTKGPTDGRAGRGG